MYKISNKDKENLGDKLRGNTPLISILIRSPRSFPMSFSFLAKVQI